MTDQKLTHFDQQGHAIMVDVSNKAATKRAATAAGRVVMSESTCDLIRAGGFKKGDVLSIARLAGIMGAKRTPDLIPLCHPLMLTSVRVDLTLQARSVDIRAECQLTGQTGVEMEALTAVSIAALTVYDMCKAVDKAMVISDIRLLEKKGGRSGHYLAEPDK